MKIQRAETKRDLYDSKNRVLILMSTYNGEKFIEEQIESIESQKTNTPFDILIRDDGSTDNTFNKLAELAKKYKNINIIKGQNIGCNASFFELFKLAKDHAYYAISDQDDIWIENKLQTGINKLSQEDKKTPTLFGSPSNLITENGITLNKTTQKQIRGITPENAIIQNIVPGHSMLFNDSLLALLQQNIDTTKIYVYDFWITNIAITYGKIIFDNSPLTKYRIHNNNTVGYGKNKIVWIKERLKRFKNNDGIKITEQIKYFYKLNSQAMTTNLKKEVEKYIKQNTNFHNRLKFVFSTKLYRQKHSETFLFKLAYLTGKYKDTK